MARPNYGAEKRRRELERQKKQEAKREKRLQKSRDKGEDQPAAGPESSDNP